jgi:hypothetical protein
VTVALSTLSVTATTTATPLALAEGTASGVAAERGLGVADNGMGVEITVPAGGQTVYVGGANVTAAGPTQGRAVAGGSSFAFDLDAREAVYLITATGTQAVTVFATGV